MTFAHNLLTSSPYDYRESISRVVALAVHPAARRRRGAGRQDRLPGARDRRVGVLGAVPLQPPRARVEHPAAVPRAARTSSTAAATPARRAMNRQPPARARDRRVHGLLLRAGACSGRCAPTCRTHLGLSDVQTSAMVAVPGAARLADAHPARLAHRPSTAGGGCSSRCMAFTPAAARRARAVARLARRDPGASASCSASPAPRSRSACRSSTAGTRPSARASRSASTGWGWAARCSPGSPPRGSPTAGAWRRRSGSPPALRRRRRRRSGSRWPATRRATGRAGPAPGMFAVARRCSARSGRAWALTLFYFLAFGGFVAMFLYLPKLLTGVHDLTKADAGARAAGFALLAVIGAPHRRLALRPRRRRARAARLLRRGRRPGRSCSPSPTRRWSR